MSKKEESEINPSAQDAACDDIWDHARIASANSRAVQALLDERETKQKALSEQTKRAIKLAKDPKDMSPERVLDLYLKNQDVARVVNYVVDREINRLENVRKKMSPMLRNAMPEEEDAIQAFSDHAVDLKVIFGRAFEAIVYGPGRAVSPQRTWKRDFLITMVQGQKFEDEVQKVEPHIRQELETLIVNGEPAVNVDAAMYIFKQVALEIKPALTHILGDELRRAAEREL